MRQYGLSEARVKRILHTPNRVEVGIAPKTIAYMQPAALKFEGKKIAWKQELWVMVVDEKSRRKIISAWRYPGVTKPGSEIALDLISREYGEYGSQI